MSLLKYSREFTTGSREKKTKMFGKNMINRDVITENRDAVTDNWNVCNGSVEVRGASWQKKGGICQVRIVKSV